MVTQRLALPLDRVSAWQPLGIRRAWLGRILGLGPCGSFSTHALVNGYSLSAFQPDPGKTRGVQTLEHHPHHPHFLPGHCGYFSHPLGDAFFSARIQPVCYRSFVLCFYNLHTDRLTCTAWVPLVKVEHWIPDQILFLPGIVLSVQQFDLCCDLFNLHGGRLVPDLFRTCNRSTGHRRTSIL